MKGCRPVTQEEFAHILSKLGDKHNRYRTRNQLLFCLGVKTGFRISELLSLKVKDAIQYGKPVTKLTVTRRNMKGKIESRGVALHEQAKPLIMAWVAEAKLGAEDFLFSSQKGGAALRRESACHILSKAYELLMLPGKLGTHCMRKTFANAIYEYTNHDLVRTQAALGHKWVSTTAQYIAFREEEVDEAILAS